MTDKIINVHHNDGGNGGCCCCIGIGIGYLLWGTPSHGATIDNKESGIKSVEKIVQVENSENKGFLVRQIEYYQQNISPQIKQDLNVDRLCRYTPSCSAYSKQAIEKHGSLKGSALAVSRLLRCNPLSKGGYDPVK